MVVWLFIFIGCVLVGGVIYDKNFFIEYKDLLYSV